MELGRIVNQAAAAKTSKVTNKSPEMINCSSLPVPFSDGLSFVSSPVSPSLLIAPGDWASLSRCGVRGTAGF